MKKYDVIVVGPVRGLFDYLGVSDKIDWVDIPANGKCGYCRSRLLSG